MAASSIKHRIRRAVQSLHPGYRKSTYRGEQDRTASGHMRSGRSFGGAPCVR